MKRRLLVLWMAMVVGMALLSMCGGARVGYQGGYDTAYRGQARGGYSAGGGSAGWDTFFVTITMRPAMTDTTTGTAYLDAYSDSLAAAFANSDDIFKLGVDDPTFAYALVDTYHTGRSYWTMASATSQASELRPRVTGVGDVLVPPVVTRWDATDTTTANGPIAPRHLLVHFTPDIPANSTIVSAKLNVCGINWYSTSKDTVVATLMTRANDEYWWTKKQVWDARPDSVGGDTYAGSTDKLNYMSKCSYSYQNYEVPSGTTYGYNDATERPWYPALSLRKYYWDWGDYSDWTPTGAMSGVNGHFGIDITDCVQAIADGKTNNGIVISANKLSASDPIRRIYGFEPTGATEKHYAPYITIKYITKRNTGLFPGGKQFAFVYQTDDGREAFNDSLVTIFGNNGGKFTAFLCDSLTRNSPTCATYTEAAEWHDSGVVEIGYHSKHHRAGPASEYLTWYEKSGIDAGKMTLLRNQMDPETMWAAADSIGRPDLRASPTWGRSIALPGYPYSATVIKVANEFNYNAIRVGTASATVGVKNDYRRLPFWRPAASDTARAGLIGRSPRNMLLLPLETEANAIVGEKANTTITEAQVKHNFRKLCRQIKGQDRYVLSMYEHDFKSGSYSYGIDPEEMRWMLQVAQEEGAWIASASEASNWLKSGSAAINTPAAAAKPDSFKYEASDRVWFKPNGIDNRWIRSVPVPAAQIQSFDTVDPDAPTLSVVFGADGQSVIVWSASPSTDVQYYNVYRYFDGASAVKIGTSTTTNYFDTTAINGSPHNYYVTAVDHAGNESVASATMTTTPGDIMTINGGDRPPYYAMWFQDPGASLTSDEIADIASFDAIVTGPFAMEGAGTEPAYTGLLDAVRAINPDHIMLQYVHPWQVRIDGQGANRSPYKRIKAYCDTGTSGADTLGYACNVAGKIVKSYDESAKTWHVNVMRAGAADSVAFIWAEAYQHLSQMSGEYTGLFVDDVVYDLQTTVYDSGNSGDTSQMGTIADFDNDNTVFDSDADEKAALQTYMVNFVKALRREFAQRGLQNRLIVANSLIGRATSPGANATAIFSRLDGNMIEGPNVWFPGNAASDTTWDRTFGVRDLMTHAQTAPAMQLFQVKSDSSIAYQSEILALANDSWVCAQGDLATRYGNDAVPEMVRRLPVLPGLLRNREVAEGGSDPDTLIVDRTNMTAKILLQRNVGAPDDTFAVWPYIIAAGTDTISRSLYWERAGEEGAPPVAQSQILTGDRMLTLAIGAGVGDYVPSDFSHFLIAREYKISSTAYYDTFTVDPDTLDSVYGATGSWWWYDTGLTNGRQYKYKVFSVDVLGNVGTPAPQVTQTPGDITPPAVPDLSWRPAAMASLTSIGRSRSRPPTSRTSACGAHWAMGPSRCTTR
jgi:hypothetical protein